MTKELPDQKNNNLMDNEPKIFVYYLNITGLHGDEIQNDAQTVKALMDKYLEGLNSVMVIVPTEEHTRIECINPKYITNEKLIENHEFLLKELHDKIKFNLDQIKNA
jgi:hypothetical protein